MKINLSELNHVNFNQKQKLPDCSAIYFVINYLYQGVFYIGKTSNLHQRWQGHHRQQQLEKIAKKTPLLIAWLECQASSLDSLETHYIEIFDPLFNNIPVGKQKITPSQVILKKSLEKIAKYTIVFGIIPGNNQQLPTLLIRYFWCGYNGTGKEGNLIRRSLKALNKKSSTLRWREILKRKDTPWWGCKCNGYQIELAPVPSLETSITRRALNDPMTSILLDRTYGNNCSFSTEQLRSIKKINIPLAQVGSVLKSYPGGLKVFPLQADAQIKQIAGVEMLALTSSQIEEIKIKEKKINEYNGLIPINTDPIPLLFSLETSSLPIRSKHLKEW